MKMSLTDALACGFNIALIRMGFPWYWAIGSTLIFYFLCFLLRASMGTVPWLKKADEI